MRGLTSCRQVLGGRDHFSASLPLLAFVKNVSLMNPSLDPEYKGVMVHTLADTPSIGRGVHPWGCWFLLPIAAVGWALGIGRFLADGREGTY